MKTKSPLSYFGSDADVAERIAAYFDECSHVCILFVGGASILPYLSGKRLVCNDLNDLAINFYQCASGVYGKDSAEELFKMCSRTLSHPADVEYARIFIEDENENIVGRAWAYWTFCWCGRGGQGGTEKITEQTKASFRMSASGGSNASRINTAAEDLPLWAEHFKNCEWTCMDFMELLKKVHDKPNSGIYADPCWYGQGDAYLHKFTDLQHKLLASNLQLLSMARVLVRYGDCPFIRDLYSAPNWHITEASARNQANNSVPEIWITNYAM